MSAIAYVAGGCFWGVEHYLAELDGVLGATSGFMGGSFVDPSYEDVVRGDTGHAETVAVEYDPERVSYEAVLKRFFEIHDPTQLNHQGPDIGVQYRSAVFYGSEEEREIAQKLIDQLVELGYDVVTTLEPAAEFYPAEEYHQEYYKKTGKTPYCHVPVDRFSSPV